LTATLVAVGLFLTHLLKTHFVATDHNCAVHVLNQHCGVPDVLITPEQVAQAVLALSQRLDHAGRVVLCRAGQPLQLLPIEVVGYGQLEPF